nr:RNA-dependent RNA polymerase [Sarcosphaera coronaria partitivirus]
MVFNSIRNYLSEFRKTQLAEWNIFQRHYPDPVLRPPAAPQQDIDYLRLASGYHHKDVEQHLTDEYKQHHADTYYGFAESDRLHGSPYELYMDITPDQIPDNRLPNPGITVLPVKLHSDQVITATESVPETGYELHPILRHLIYSKYPRYIPYITTLVRPLGTTDATFQDFNREQNQYPEVPQNLASRITDLIIHFLYALPILPLHYVDTFFIKMPLHTGTSYFYRHSYELKTHAAFSHPPEYATKTTSKGYFVNAFTEWARTVVHRIKEYAHPFATENLTQQQIDSKLRQFFIEHATMLFTRNHISDRNGALKQRPVYAMDTLFLHLEAMLTFPLHVLARSMKSSLMYSIETIRGGCAYMDSLAMSFHSYLCLDWSSFDQRMPWIIVDHFFTTFLPRILVINHGYQPTVEYPEYPDLTPSKMFSRLFNLICFLRTWYFNCVFATADGYAYVRRFAGIASGMLNTQYLDSYCNLFLMLHALIHFGCTDDEIKELIIFVMGDDNVILSLWEPKRLHDFMVFFEKHALSRFGMVLSSSKSIFTTLRSKIEMLGYTCNNGQPTRKISKLVAQLCFPEHGPKDKYMSSRAIGMAYAAAGFDLTFHSFCYDVYLSFLPYSQPDTEETLRYQAKHLPGIFKMLDDPFEFITLERFPTMSEIRTRYSTWQGELDPLKKWNPAHFTSMPGTVPADYQTMEQYAHEHDILFPTVTRLF